MVVVVIIIHIISVCDLSNNIAQGQQNKWQIDPRNRNGKTGKRD